MAGKRKRPISLPEGIEEHRSFQRRMWLVQRWAWTTFAFVLAVSLLGVFGRGGYFSRGEVNLPGGILELPTIARWNAPDDLTVTFGPAEEERSLVFDRRFFEIFSIEGIDPPPRTTSVLNGNSAYVFAADPQHPATVIFRLRLQQPGIRTFSAGIGEHVAEPTVIVLP